MKTLKFIIAAFALVFTINITSANENPVKPSAQLRAEMVELMSSSSPYELLVDEATAEVIFTVNSSGEVIIISVISDDERTVKHIKNQINYKKVSHRTSKPGEMYLMPVRVVKS